MRLIPLEELRDDIYKREGVRLAIKKATGLVFTKLYSDFYPKELPANSTTADILKRIKAMYNKCGAYVTTHEINSDAIVTSFQVDFKDNKPVGMHLIMEHFNKDTALEEIERELTGFNQYVLVFRDGSTKHIEPKPDISGLINKLRGFPTSPQSPDI